VLRPVFFRCNYENVVEVSDFCVFSKKASAEKCGMYALSLLILSYLCLIGVSILCGGNIVARSTWHFY
jgi:hypothetical protein